jgi:hypothetical protein
VLYSDSAEKSTSSQNKRRRTPEDWSVPRERQTVTQPMCVTTEPLKRIIGMGINLHASTIRILRELSGSRFCHQERTHSADGILTPTAGLNLVPPRTGHEGSGGNKFPAAAQPGITSQSGTTSYHADCT